MSLKQFNFNDTINILKRYKIPLPKMKLIESFNQAIQFAKINKYPIVLKVDPNKYIHKTDKKGVIIDINNEQELKKSFNLLKKKSDIILIQKQYCGPAVAIGMKRDPSFGPTIMFGLGGIYIEILKDITFRIAPVSITEAKKMIKETKTYELLKGARGSKKVNLTKLANIITKISKLSVENSWIKEIDINPLIAEGQKIIAVDMRLLYES